MLRRVTLMVALAAIAVLVVAPAAQSKIITCKSGHVCKGTEFSDYIYGSPGNDRILPMSGEDYVFANGGNDDVAHSYDADMIFGGCGSDTVRGGGAADIIYANMPTTLSYAGACPVIGPVELVNPLTITVSQATRDDIKTLSIANQNDQTLDVPDHYHDLVDCAWLSSRDEPRDDLGFGQRPITDTPSDTVVDCINRDDQ
jgi:Ca2+-binding RTX toxin-like protein